MKVCISGGGAENRGVSSQSDSDVLVASLEIQTLIVEYEQLSETVT